MCDNPKKVDIRTCSEKDFYDAFDDDKIRNLWHGLLHYNSALREYWECLEEIEKMLGENIKKQEEHAVDKAAEPEEEAADSQPCGVQGHLV